MHSYIESTSISKKKIWTGRILTGIAVLFMLMDSIIKLLKLQPAIDSTMQLGYPEHLVFVIGLIEFICIAVYLIPGTTVPGAILLTGYLGEAVATNLRAETSLFGNVLFPVYLGVMLWGGLYLRDSLLNIIIPIRKGDK